MRNRIESAISGMSHRCHRPWYLRVATVVALGLLLASLQGAEPARAAAGDAVYEPRVVGGSDVPDGKYPFMAALRDTRYGSTADEQQFCGGTLIDQDSVLTAAHCVVGSSVAPLRVTVGRTVLSSGQGQTRGVSKIYVHPNYNGNSSDAYDATVLDLDGPVTGIAPIKLASANQDFLEKAGRYATVAGWGNTITQPVSGTVGNDYPNRMREAHVPLISDSHAEQVYGGEFLPKLMVAAGERGKDTCQGDSGGPMFAVTSGKYRQIGITSFGYGCGAAGYPGVYTEVNSSSIRSFITNAASKR